jgi:uncharacterized membrane protein YphA (DoxX/SURF4 family)
MGGAQKLSGMEALQGTAQYAAGGFSGWGLSLPDNVVLAAVAIAALLEVVGGLLLAIGQEELGAKILLAFLVPVTIIIHRPTSQNETIALLKNAALAGAFLYIISANAAKRAAKAKGKTA